MENQTIIKNATLHLGDCLDVMKEMSSNSIDSIVTDPPYGLKFMGKKWDYDVPSVKVWKEALRVLKPGGHLLSFGGSRTYHRMVVNIEDAGFDIRDQIMWIYGSGFPKSLNISKAIDKEAGAKRKVTGEYGWPDGKTRNTKQHTTKRTGIYSDIKTNDEKNDRSITAPATPEAKQWDGWGTALKPAHEPICVARKPITEKTIAKNILKYGTGGINIDGCKILTKELIQCQRGVTENKNVYGDYKESYDGKGRQYQGKGRWPANLIHDGGLEVEKAFAKYGKRGGGFSKRGASPNWGPASKGGGTMETVGFGDEGTASRFFYCAKASKSERDEGLIGVKPQFAPTMGNGIGGKEHDPETATYKRNHHPTVKPIALMRYLVRLVTPPGGTVLDMYMGSVTTGIAARQEGFKFIGIERDKEYFDIACKRIKYAQLKGSK